MKIFSKYLYLLLFSMLLLLAQLFAEVLNPLLQYNQSLVIKGEAYRLISFYFCHISITHWLFNHVQFIFLFLWIAPFFNNQLWSYFFLMGMLCISGTQLTLFATSKNIMGFSGLNYALLSLLLLIYGQGRKLFLGIWSGVLIKVLIEFSMGRSISEEILGVGVGHQQHLVGFLMAIPFFFLFLRKPILSKKPDKK